MRRRLWLALLAVGFLLASAVVEHEGEPVTTSLYMPDVQVEIAFNAGVNTPATSRTWTDVSAYVELHEGISITHGRGDERSEADPNQLTLTLDNKDGRFTAGRAASPYYPNVKIGRPIRVTATPPGGTASVRFVGFVDEWPVEWDGTDQYAKATVTATSRLARLGAQAELRSIIEEEVYEQGDPVRYYLLNEPSEAIVAADSSGAGHPVLTQAGTGTAVAFGNATGPANDGYTAAQFAGGKYLTRSHPAAVTPGASLTLLCAFRVTGTTGIGAPLLELTSPQANGLVPPKEEVTLAVSAVGSNPLEANVVGNNGSGSFNWPITSAAGVNDGETHVAALTISGLTLSLYLDGSLSTFTTMTGRITPGDLQVVNVGGSVTDGGAGSYVIAHALVFDQVLSSVDISEISEVMLDDFTETAGQAITRLATFTGVPAAEVSAEAGSVQQLTAVDPTGITALEAMRKVEATESGVLFDGRDGTLTFHGRAHRYTATAEAILDATLGQVESTFAPRVDRSALLNDVTAALANGQTEARVVDQGSVDDYGTARDSLELHTADSTEPLQAASWRVTRYKEPILRAPTLGVDVTAVVGNPYGSGVYGSGVYGGDAVGAIFGLGVGSRITVQGLPSQAAATSEDFFVEGYTETISPESYRLDLNVTPSTLWDVWIVEDPVRGQYDAYRIGY